MRSPCGSVPITTRLACGRKPSRCGTIVSSASGESARNWTEGGSGACPGSGLCGPGLCGPGLCGPGLCGPGLCPEMSGGGGVSSPAVSACVIQPGCGEGGCSDPVVELAVDNVSDGGRYPQIFCGVLTHGNEGGRGYRLMPRRAS